MKNKLIIFFLLLSLNGFSQIVRTLPNVNNTADTSKPVSAPQKTAINQKLHTVSTIAALQAFTSSSVCQFDGSTWNLTSGNVASNGGSYAGTIINVNTSFYWQRKFDATVNVIWFGAVGDDATINTTQIQNAINYINNSVQSVSEVANGITDVYSATLYTLYFPKGRYRIDGVLTGGSYLNIKGENSAIIQMTTATDIFYSNSFYKWNFDGINFVGGKSHVDVGNGNIDQTMLKFVNCYFRLSSDYSIKTFVTGTTYTHLSANLLIDKCTFSRCKKGIQSYCDLAKISNSWVFWDYTNMAANTGFIYIRGDDNHSILTLDNFFGVPDANTGASRVANVRWIDSYGSVYVNNSRFGGESAGIPIVYYFQPYNTVYPYVGKTVSIQNSWVYSGLSNQNDSGTIIINGQVPQKISLINNDGPSDVPYVVNYSATNLANYFTAFETTTGKKAYNYFSVDIRNNMANNTSGNIYNKKLPDELKAYIVGTKRTSVRRVASQVITNGFVANAISFDNVIFDNAGCYSSSNPTRLTLPIGASRATIKVFFKIAGHATSETLTVKLKDSSGNYLGGLSSVTSVNADDNAYSFSSDVLSYTNNDFYYIEIYTTASANLSLIDARVSISLIDYIN